MSVVTLKSQDSASTATIVVDRGFNCVEFKADTGRVLVDVLDSDPGYATGDGRPSGNGIPILFPFPNRIRGGRYVWAGKEYALPERKVGWDRTGNAIHGFCLDRPWRIVDQTADSVVGEFQLSVDAPDRADLWPSDFVLRVRYEVSGGRLASEFDVLNPDEKTLPWGLGTHAYFKVPLSPGSNPQDCRLFAPVSGQWELIDCLPTGQKLPMPEGLALRDGVRFGVRPLDDVFTGVPADLVECAIVDEKAGVKMSQWNPGSFRELVIYTPPNRNAICFEPYTCLTDAVNLQARGLDAGWRTLGPGESFSTWIDISAEAVN
jgi:aldose 1-epimerase